MDTIGVIGIGKLGLCFSLNAEKKGFQIIGIDNNKEYVNQLNSKSFKSIEPHVNDFLKEATHFTASDNINTLFQHPISMIFVFVATPSLPDGSYDHQQIERITDQLIALGERETETHLIIGCTTMPGYCGQLAKKMKPYNYTVSYNPEFIAQGSIIVNQQKPDQILIGEANTFIGNEIEAFYKIFCNNTPTFCKMDPLSAEIAKIATNCFLTTKISFANSVGDLAIKTGADKDKILAAIGADSRIGSKYLQYGFGFGGPCFPRDNRALGKFADDNQYNLLISKATDEVNKMHLDFQFQYYLAKYNEESTIIFEGVAYKQDTILIEESQKLLLAVKLALSGRKVLIKDRIEVINQVEELYPSLFNFEEA